MSRQLTHWDIVALNKMIICNDCKCEVKLGYIKRHNLTKKHIEIRATNALIETKHECNGGGVVRP